MMPQGDGRWWGDSTLLEAIGGAVAAIFVGALKLFSLLKKEQVAPKGTNGKPIPLGPDPAAEVERQSEMFKFFNKFEDSLADIRDTNTSQSNAMTGLRTEIEGFRGDFRRHIAQDDARFDELDQQIKERNGK